MGGSGLWAAKCGGLTVGDRADGRADRVCRPGRCEGVRLVGDKAAGGCPSEERRSGPRERACRETADQPRYPVQQPRMWRSGDRWPVTRQGIAALHDRAVPMCCDDSLCAPALAHSHGGPYLARSWPALPSVLHRQAGKLCRRSAFDSDESLRVAAQKAWRHRDRRPALGSRRPRVPTIIAGICALLLGCTIPAVAVANTDVAGIAPRICASHSTARGLQTTSATAGAPASFTIQVCHVQCIVQPRAPCVLVLITLAFSCPESGLVWPAACARVWDLCGQFFARKGHPLLHLNDAQRRWNH